MSKAKGMTRALSLLFVFLLAACEPQVQQQVPEKFPSAWEFESYSEGTSFENRIAWVEAENDYPKERLFLDTRTRRHQSELWPVLRMSKPYGCEVNSIDVAIHTQLFEVEIWDHHTDVIFTPASDSGVPFWNAFRSGEKLGLTLAWNCDYPDALPAQNGALATFSLTGADYAVHYVTGGVS